MEKASLKTIQLYCVVNKAFACHFVAPHHPYLLPYTGTCGIAKKVSKVVGNSDSY